MNRFPFPTRLVAIAGLMGIAGLALVTNPVVASAQNPIEEVVDCVDASADEFVDCVEEHAWYVSALCAAEYAANGTLCIASVGDVKQLAPDAR